jgi:hypothetical protein
VQNLVQGELVNGSVGQVISFSNPKEMAEDRTTPAKGCGIPGGQSDLNRPSIGTFQTEMRWPLVRFTSGKELLIIPAEFTVNNALGGMEARRDQVI